MTTATTATEQADELEIQVMRLERINADLLAALEDVYECYETGGEFDVAAVIAAIAAATCP